MTAIADLFGQIDALRTHASRVIEESFRLTLEGSALDMPVVTIIKQIHVLAGQLGINPTVMVAEESINTEELADPAPLLGESWRIVIGKTGLAERLSARDVESTVLFFSVDGFGNWVSKLDPFQLPTGHDDPDFSGPTTIRVHGLTEAFGGPLLWILPVEATAPEELTTKLPEDADVHGLVHIINSDRSLRVSPKGFALTWGALGEAAAPLIRLSAMVMSACLVQELKRIEEKYEVTLRGTKRISLPLIASGETPALAQLSLLIEAVTWVYEERPETRLKLVMDRLSIDIEMGQTLLSGMQLYLDSALQQARDSYSFVILERKDAYHKEMRELMKDMKSQADLYAAKVRDLVSSLTRDILGVLVFIGFSFIGKFDQQNIQKLLASSELSLLAKVLAGYLLLSCVIQLIAHWRDASLAYAESQRWLDILQNYTSRKDNQERFLDPIDKRKCTLFAAMWFSGAFYLVLAFLIWNLPFTVQLLLAQ